MNVKIFIINAPEEKKDMDIDFYTYRGENCFALFFPSQEKYLKFLKSKKLFRSDFYNLSDDTIKYLEDNIEIFSTQVINAKPIYIIFDISDIKLVDNVILDISNLSWQDKLYVINNMANSSTSFIDSYSLDEVLSLDEITCMYRFIESTVENIKDKSPLEQIYYIYDLLKKRPYLSLEDSYYESRSLNRVIYSNPIVCMGFANYFKAMANSLNINVEDLRWKRKMFHISNICYINDKKYDVVGIFAIDVTWDNQKKSLKHFLRPLKAEIDEKHNKGYTLGVNKNSINELFAKHLEFLKTKTEQDRLHIKLELIEIINKIYKLLKINKKIDIICNIEQEIRLIYELTEVDLSLFTLDSLIPSNEQKLELLRSSL